MPARPMQITQYGEIYPGKASEVSGECMLLCITQEAITSGSSGSLQEVLTDDTSVGDIITARNLGRDCPSGKHVIVMLDAPGGSYFIYQNCTKP